MDGSSRRGAGARARHVVLLVIGVLVGCFLTIDAIGSATQERTASSSSSQRPAEDRAVTVVTPELTCHHTGTADAPDELASPCAQASLTSSGLLRAPDSAAVTVTISGHDQQPRYCARVLCSDRPSLTGLSISRT